MEAEPQRTPSKRRRHLDIIRGRKRARVHANAEVGRNDRMLANQELRFAALLLFSALFSPLLDHLISCFIVGFSADFT